MYFYQQGGMTPEEQMMMEQQGQPQQQGGGEEEIAMQIMEAFMQLSPEMQMQLLEAMAQAVQQQAAPQEQIPMQKYGGKSKKRNPYK
jgi:hypothetical protein